MSENKNIENYLETIGQSDLIEKRKMFFESALHYLTLEPTKIDFYLLQAYSFIEIDKAAADINAEFGDFWLPINTRIQNYNLSFVYSMWQFGPILKIGLIGYENKNCPIPRLWHSCQEEISSIWHKPAESDDLGLEYMSESERGKKTKVTPEFVVREDMLFCEWTFNASNLYDNFQNQEYFILGLRHMHFRTISILSKKIKEYIDANK